MFVLLAGISLSKAFLACAAVYAVWHILRIFASRSTLGYLLGPPSPSFIGGNLSQLLSPRGSWAFRRDIANKYGRVALLHGQFGRDMVYTHDPRAFHSIFVKEHDIYEESLTTMRLMLGPGLLSTGGAQHRRQRKMLNPVFSARHLREMTPLFYQVVHKARDAIGARVKASAPASGGAAAEVGVELDMLSWMGRITLEVLGKAGLGHSFDPLTEDHPDEFAHAVKDFFPRLADSIVIRTILLPLIRSRIGSPSLRRRIVELTPVQIVQRLREIADILQERSVLIVNEKKAALERGDEGLKQQIGEGRDVMSILLRENTKSSADEKLTDEELTAQVSTMILAGMDTTANSLARVLQLLSENPEVQEALRKEIMDTTDDAGSSTVDYDTLMALPYLDAVCRETFRVSPGISLLARDLAQDTVLPLLEPVRLSNGTTASSLPMPKGTRFILDVVACNCDPTLWGADAAEWRPARWLEPLPSAVEDARIPSVYSHLMTFIAGTKSCIGFKFAQVEIKSVLFVLLQHFRFAPSDKQITWNFAGVQYPTVRGPSVDSSVPELPLRVIPLRNT